MTAMDGIIVLDKPPGISSHDAVQKLRKLSGIKRVGHLGTLDPLGTGVLPLVIGRATRLSRFFLKHDRTYEAVLRFGFATTTYDREGEKTTEPVETVLSAEELEPLLDEFRGRFLQTPPPVSAKKIEGVPAYKLARKNKPVELEAVEIEVYELSLLGVDGPCARIRVRCSAGTYVRSLAHDLGMRLGPGAHVESLRRTSMGEFTLDHAHTLEELEELRRGGRLDEALMRSEHVLPEMPTERIDEVTAALIAHGRDFRVSAFGGGKGSQRIKAVDRDGNLIAIAEAKMPLVYHPIVVF
jgi:tRNA pseudouridine55 synthase